MGGVRVPGSIGAQGHSDADVLTHAVADAILGAAALGDLGSFFPDTDPQWKDANSLDLLERCIGELHAAGFHVENVDATIVLESPKIAPHLHAMRENLSVRLGIPLERTSVKAKTSEGMGYTGDGSGIAAYAVAVIAERAQ